MDQLMGIVEAMFDRNIAPDWLVRTGIRYLLGTRLKQESSSDIDDEMRGKMDLLKMLAESRIAVHQDKANEQHYEVPTKFFELHLGHRLKYSSSYFPTPSTTLDEAEDHMLQLYCDRVGLQDGMDVLDLGCGWGSLSLYIAEHYPKCKITSISNSATQKQFINSKGFKNVNVITGDISTLTVDKIDAKPFDVVFSIEMFEHMRNYSMLMKKISSVLKVNGSLFVHIFCHAKYIYCMETEGPTNWMGRHFFTGGTMPCDDVLSYFQQDLNIVNRWRVNGCNYAQTAELWLQNFDAQIDKIRPILKSTYGKQATKWEAYWRTFYMAVAELFGYNEGKEWHVALYHFKKLRE